MQKAGQYNTLHSENGDKGTETLDEFQSAIAEAAASLNVQFPASRESQSPTCRCNEMLNVYSSTLGQIHAENQDLKQTVHHLHADNFDGENRSMLTGTNALGSKLFRMRALVVVLSCISFSIMATVREALNNVGVYHPSQHFNCWYYSVRHGTFSTVPYTAVFAVGVTVCVYSVALCLYYLLPVNENNQKYIPGLNSLVQECMDRPGSADEMLNSLSSWGCGCWSGLIEVRADRFLSLACLAVFVVAAVALEQPVRFEERYWYASSDGAYPYAYIYYSLDTFYATFSSAGDRDCLPYRNPIARLRASLAMMFLTMCVMMLCARRSWRMWSKEAEGGRQMVPTVESSHHAAESREGLLTEGQHTNTTLHHQSSTPHARPITEDGVTLHDLAQQLHHALHAIGASPPRLGTNGAPLGDDLQSCLLLLRVYLDAAAHVLEENRVLKAAGTTEDAKDNGTRSQKRLFWLRVAAGVFSLISLSVMATVQHIGRQQWDAHGSYFLMSDCGNVYRGENVFHMAPFHYVIAAAGCVVLYALMCIVYRVLPGDGDNHKYIPGLHAVGQDLFNRPSIGEVLRAIHSYFADHGLWMQTVLDAVLSVLLLSAFVIAAVALDTPVRFRDKFNQPIYYSLVTYYATYGPDNECHSEAGDTIPKMRASLAMLFFAWCAVVQGLRLSWRQWRAQAAAGSTSSSSSSSGRGGLIEHSNPLTTLPSASDHSAGSAGGAAGAEV